MLNLSYENELSGIRYCLCGGKKEFFLLLLLLLLFSFYKSYHLIRRKMCDAKFYLNDQRKKPYALRKYLWHKDKKGKSLFSREIKIS